MAWANVRATIFLVECENSLEFPFTRNSPAREILHFPQGPRNSHDIFVETTFGQPLAHFKFILDEDSRLQGVQMLGQYREVENSAVRITNSRRKMEFRIRLALV